MLTSPHLPPLPLVLLLFFVISLSFNAVCAQRNVSVDDGDPSIRYQPPGAWFRSANSSLDFGFAHMLTQNENATATFNFTGIAIYFLSPLWPYLVNTEVSLDGGPPTLVDLVDHSRPTTEDLGPETVQYDVVWSAQNLRNTSHTLVMRVGEGQPFGIVDGLIYTVLDPPENETSIEPGATTSTSGSPDPTNTPPPPPPPPRSTSSNTPVVVGAALGVFGVLLVALFVWFCLHKRNRRPTSEAWTITSSSHGGSKSMSRATNTGTTRPSPISLGPPATYPGPQVSQTTAAHGGVHHPYSSIYAAPLTEEEAWRNPRYGYVGMPTPSHSSDGGHDGVRDDRDSGYSDPDGRAGSPSGGFGVGGLVFPHPPPPLATMSPSRYAHGVTLSTITEDSPRSLGSRSLSARGSPASGVEGHGYFPAPSRMESGNSLNSSSAKGSQAGGTSPTISPSASGGGLAARHELHRVRGTIRGGSLLAREPRLSPSSSGSSSSSPASGPLGARGIPRF